MGVEGSRDTLGSYLLPGRGVLYQFAQNSSPDNLYYLNLVCSLHSPKRVVSIWLYLIVLTWYFNFIKHYYEEKKTLSTLLDSLCQVIEISMNNGVE